MPVPFTPLAVANCFLEKFGNTDGIEHMKLQKLVYCSYGWWLAAHGMDNLRFTSERPEIWKHGPVFDSLYHTLKVFGHERITSPQSANPFAPAENIPSEDSQARAFVDWIWGRYGHLSGFALSDLTHKPGTPWYRIAAESDFSVAYNTAIPDKYIFEEFSKLLNAAQNTEAHQHESQNDRRQQPA